MDPTHLRARLAELLSDYRIPSAAIAVLHDGAITELAVGVRNVSTKTPATTDTIYQCGSMTKTWTALAFMPYFPQVGHPKWEQFQSAVR
jgi:CubicO group peptidase (beta-lactamase class C family)